MQEKIVSVIVPAYNGEKHLAATLESIINQDYKNLEIIFVNDASTDNTLNIAENILKNSGRIYKIINHEKNSGVSVSRNDGLNIAQGEYIWFCDSDDLADKSFVSIMYTKAESENADIVFCNFVLYFETEKRYENYQSFTQENSLTGEECIKLLVAHNGFKGTIGNRIIKKNLIDKLGLRFTKGCKSGEDSEFLIKAITSSSKIAFETKALYIYVQHPEQTTKTFNENKNPKFYSNFMLARYRAGRYVMRKIKNQRVRNYILSFFIADLLLEYCKICINTENRKYYDLKIKNFKHKKIRQVMLSTWHFILEKPELFFKSLMLLYAPNLYYKLRSKKSKK